MWHLNCLDKQVKMQGQIVNCVECSAQKVNPEMVADCLRLMRWSLASFQLAYTELTERWPLRRIVRWPQSAVAAPGQKQTTSTSKMFEGSILAPNYIIDGRVLSLTKKTVEESKIAPNALK